jgi:hypothetical protein
MGYAGIGAVKAPSDSWSFGAGVLRDGAIVTEDDWYYELDGRAHGPLSWSDLVDLLGRSGETAADVHIRKGTAGEWTAFRSGSAPVRPPDLSRPAAERSEQPPAQRSQLRTQGSGFSSLFQRHRDIAAAVGIWILLNVLFLLFWPEPYARERRYLTTLQGVVGEADLLRAKGASDREWSELAKRARATLAPMIGDLQKSASSSELPRQQLLWCARDLAPRIMGPPTKERDDQERRLKQYLESVEQASGRH